MTDSRAVVRGLGATAAVLGTLAFAVGAPVRKPHTARDTVVSAATRDALANCDQGVRLLEKGHGGGASFKESDPLKGGCSSSTQSISALELARWIRDGRPGLRVLDLRGPAAYETKHIPSAESFALRELASVLPKPGETVVVYSDDDLRDAQATAWLTGVGHARVHVLRGGMSAWVTEVLSPVVQGDSAMAIAALSRYFGGVPRMAGPDDDARTSPKARANNTAEVFDFVARRGC